MRSRDRKSPDVKISYSRIALTVIGVLIIAVLILTQKSNLDIYYRHLTEDPRPIALNFNDLSEDWTKSKLKERFSDLPVACYPYAGRMSVDSACALEGNSLNGLPTLYLSFFFKDDRLSQVSVNVPWWSHKEAYNSLKQSHGDPTYSQFIPVNGVRLRGWKLPDGSGLFINRDQPLNPFSWNSIQWRSASSCGESGCFIERIGKDENLFN